MRKTVFHVLISCAVLLCAVNNTSAQNPVSELDSMLAVLPTLKNDSNKVLTLSQISVEYRTKDIARALVYARATLTAIESASTLPKRTAMVYNSVSSVFTVAGKYDSADLVIKRGLSISREQGDRDAEQRLYMASGILLNYKGKYPDAVENFLKALDIARELKKPTVRILGNIGNSFERMGDPKKATEYNEEAIREAEKVNDLNAKYLIMSNQATNYTALGDLPKAIATVKECAAYHRKVNNLHGLTQDLLTLAFFAEREKDYAAQGRYGSEAVAAAQQTNVLPDLASATFHQGISAYFLKDPRAAEQYSLRALALSDSSNKHDLMVKILMQLGKIAVYNHDVEHATTYFAKSDSIKTNLNLEVQKTATSEIETKYETEKKEQENQTLKKDQAVQQQRMVIVIVFVVVLLVLLVLLFRSFSRQRKANLLLTQKNKEIQEQREEIVSQSEEIEKQNKSLTRTLQELHETQAQLLHSEKMASLGQLTAGITHEINNPLNFIKLGVENLEDSLLSLENVVNGYAEKIPEETRNANMHGQLFKDIREFGKIIHMGSVRTGKIISGLRKFSYKGTEVNKPTDIQEVITDTIMLISGVTTDRIKVATHFESNLPLVSVKPMEIGQALLNVLMNATQSIEGKGTISIYAMKEGSSLLIKIQDTGKGIRPEDLGKIFDPFFTTKDVGQGTGLGLSITHGIIVNHGGTIQYESTLGEGTTCIIKLPM